MGPPAGLQPLAVKAAKNHRFYDASPKAFSAAQVCVQHMHALWSSSSLAWACAENTAVAAACAAACDQLSSTSSNLCNCNCTKATMQPRGLFNVCHCLLACRCQG